jgi:rhamnosyltransferase
LLLMIKKQECVLVQHEVVLVDSGSTDKTVEIAKKYGCRITHIKKEEFTYGRSLNVGCALAKGDYLVFISGHCIPTDETWLDEICRPLVDGDVSYSYGRQVGKGTTKYSESCHFDKWFPEYSKIPQEGFFCNNANAAITHEVWAKYKFDEGLTGLEDMYLAKQLVQSGEQIGYTSSASVYHLHDETWHQLRIRYEREAYALHQIMPEVQVTILDFWRYLFSGVLNDLSRAIGEKLFFSKFIEIILFRFNHYWGSYKGNHLTRKLSAKRKHNYFYPKDLERKSYESSRTTSDEGQ